MANHPSPLVDLSDPETRADWLAAVRRRLADLRMAAEDATAPPHARELGRRAARRLIEEAGDGIDRQLDVAGAAPIDEADTMLVAHLRATGARGA